MAKWFKEFPIALKNGTDMIRSAPETASRSRTKAALEANPGTKTAASKPGQRGAASVQSKRTRKNASEDQSRSPASSRRDGNVWENQNSKADASFVEPFRPPRRSSPPANASFISRLIRLDKQDKGPSFSGGAPGAAVETSACTSDALIILEDYADPFDAQRTRDQREAEPTGENDGYMEPYDAQQMITEIRRRGSKDLLKGQTESSEGALKGQPTAQQIYEVPYKGGGEGEKAAVTRPELDPRPASEYELPWEWRKQHIARTLSEQCESSTKDETSQPAFTKQQQHPAAPPHQHQHRRQKSWTPKILRSSPPTGPPPSSSGSSELQLCCVDPSLPLEKQSWYHGYMTRQEAELQLQSCREASFLDRDRSRFSIALKTSQGCVHIIVAQTKEHGYTLDQSSCMFPSIPEVVHHYCSQSLPFTGAEHMTLLHPVPRSH